MSARAVAVAATEDATPTETVLAWASGILPALWASSRAPAFAPAASDVAVLRDVALANLGPSRAVDAWWSAATRLLPIGSGTARAAFASAIAAGIAGRLVYALARQLVLVREDRPSRLAPLVALIAATTATLGLPFQHAAAAPGGAMLASLLILAPAVTIASDRIAPDLRMPLALGLAGLAAGRDCGTAILSLTALVIAIAAYRRASDLYLFKRTNAFFVALTTLPPIEAAIRGAAHASILSDGLSWSALSVRNAASFATSADFGKAAAGMSSPGLGAGAVAALVDANGALPLVLSFLGAASLFASPRRRTALFTALALVAPAFAFVAFSAAEAAESDTAEAALIVAASVLSALLAPALYVAVQAVRWTKDRTDLRRGPQAALLLVAESVLPVQAADLGFAPVPSTDDAAFFALVLADLPPSPIVLLHDRATYVHVRAMAARGETRSDAMLVPTFALAARTEETAHAWQSEPKLLPLYSDFVLRAGPDESSLSALASVRRVVVDADPSWDAPLLRHLTARGGWEDFHRESRGPSDRQRALDAWPMVGCTLMDKDPDDAALATALLQRRVDALTKLSEREVRERATAALLRCPSSVRLPR